MDRNLLSAVSVAQWALACKNWCRMNWQKLKSLLKATPSVADVEATTVRGLDEFGIPAPLIHAVGAGLKARGIDVWVKGSLLETWILLTDVEAFYAWARKSTVTKVHVRSAGSQARDVCRELCSLVDTGDPSAVLRAGFIEVVWVANAEFFLGYVNSQRRDAAWDTVFWRICGGRAGQPVSTWGTGHEFGLDSINKAAQCSIYCPDEAVALQVRSYLKASAIEASREVIVTNILGIHSPQSARFANAANRFEAYITVENKGVLANGKSIMGMMLLGAGPGDRLVIRARGPDAQEAVDELAARCR